MLAYQKLNLRSLLQLFFVLIRSTQSPCRRVILALQQVRSANEGRRILIRPSFKVLSIGAVT